MNTRFIDTFLMLAQLQSFRATARALHATPAAISLRIRSLEEELKCELVDRQARPFSLTPAGHSVLDAARNVVDAVAALREAAGQEVEVRGKIRVGVIETVVHSWLAHCIARLNAQLPKLEIDLTVDSSSVLQRRLLNNELDLVIRVEGIDSTTIVSSAIADYPVRWIARRGLLPRRAAGLAKRVLEWPLVTYGRGTAPQVALESILHSLARHNGVPHESVRLTCSPSVAAIVQLVRDGYGIAALPRLIVAEELKSGEFVELPLKPLPPPIIVSLCLPTGATRPVSLAANVVRDACVSWCRMHGDEWIRAL
jgi:DNA-binding transcriptional LysR family regulator